MKSEDRLKEMQDQEEHFLEKYGESYWEGAVDLENPLDRLVEEIDGKAPVNPLAEAFKNGIPLSQLGGLKERIDSVVDRALMPPAPPTAPAGAVPGAPAGAEGQRPASSGTGAAPVKDDAFFDNQRAKQSAQDEADRREQLAAAVDRGLERMRRDIEFGRTGTGMFNSRDAEERQKLLDSIEFGRKQVDPLTGRPLLDDAATVALLDQAGRTNRLQYATTNNDIGAAINRALDQPVQTDPDKYGRTEPVRVTQAIRKSIPDWLGAIAKGTVAATAGENLKQERDTTIRSGMQVKSDEMDLNRKKESQNGVIRAQRIEDDQGNLIGWSVAGNPKLLTQTQLDELKNPSSGSGYQPVGAKAPAVAPAAAPVAVENPPVDGARKAPDGNWYVQQNGQYYRVK